MVWYCVWYVSGWEAPPTQHTQEGCPRNQCNRVEKQEAPNTSFIIKLFFGQRICAFYEDEVRRGVRSDAQLSCTETRFQKCSQSGKNDSKQPNVIIIYSLLGDFMQNNRKKHSKHQNR